MLLAISDYCPICYTLRARNVSPRKTHNSRSEDTDNLSQLILQYSVERFKSPSNSASITSVPLSFTTLGTGRVVSYIYLLKIRLIDKSLEGAGETYRALSSARIQTPRAISCRYSQWDVPRSVFVESNASVSFTIVLNMIYNLICI